MEVGRAVEMTGSLSMADVTVHPPGLSTSIMPMSPIGIERQGVDRRDVEEAEDHCAFVEVLRPLEIKVSSTARSRNSTSFGFWTNNGQGSASRLWLA